MPFQSSELSDFAGLNEDESPDRLADNDLVVASNVARNGSAFGTRPGVERETAATGNYSAELSGAAVVQGIVEYMRPFVAGIRNASTQLASSLIVIHNGSIYTDSGTTLTKGAGVVVSATGRWTFAQHKQTLYMAGGADNDTINTWTGTGDVTRVTFNNAAGSGIDAKYIFQKWNYGFIGGMNGTGAEDNPMVVRHSSLGDMTTWPVGNTLGGTSSIGGFDSYGDNWITGFADYTDNDGDWLLVLTRKQIYGVLQGDNPLAPFYVGANGIVANGCVHQHAFVNLGVDSGDSVYVSENGIHSIRQSQQHGGQVDKFLSWKIRNIFKNVSKAYMHKATAAYWPDEGLVVFSLPYLGSSTNNLTLALDIRGVRELNAETARWYVWTTTGFYIAETAQARDTSGNNRIYFGTFTGDVPRFTRSVYSDLGEGYHVQWTTKHNDFGRHDRLKGFGDIYPSVRPGGDYKPQLTLLYDRGTRQSDPMFIDMPIDSDLWGSEFWGSGTWSLANQISTEKQYGDGYGYTLGMDFSHGGTNEPFFLTKVSYETSLEGESGGDV